MELFKPLLLTASVFCSFGHSHLLAQEAGVSEQVGGDEFSGQLPTQWQLPPEFDGTVYQDWSPDVQILDLENEIENMNLLPTEPFKTADPVEAPKQLTALESYARLVRLCQNGRELFCQEAGWRRDAQEYLLAGAARNPACQPAAIAMLEYYERGRPPENVSAEFDMACLGSFFSRDGEEGAASRPGVLEQAEVDRSLLSSIGVVLYGSIPVCSGLLTDDHRFITAKHCRFFVDQSGFVTQVSSGKLLNVGFMREGVGGGVSSDWAVYAVDSNTEYTASSVKFISVLRPYPATTVAAYPYNSAYDPEAPNALPAMRFPREGLCHTVFASEGCLQLICQSIGGFSGAPIFRADASPDEPEVIGFISGSLGNNVGCPVLPISDSTLAVSVASIGGLIDE